MSTDITVYNKNCRNKCDDDDNPPTGPLPYFTREVLRRPIPKPIMQTPSNWTDYIPGTPGQLEKIGIISGATGEVILIGTGVGAGYTVVRGGIGAIRNAEKARGLVDFGIRYGF